MRRARRSTVDLLGDGMTPLGQPSRPFYRDPVAATKNYFNLLISNFTLKFVVYIAAVNFLIKGLAYKAITKAALPFMTQTLSVGVIRYAEYSNVIQLGWSGKPLIAAISDLVPILGYKKRYYAACLSIFGGLALGICSFLPVAIDSAALATGLLFLAVAAVAANDVLVEGKYSEIMQSMTLGRSTIVTWVWLWYTGGGLVAGVIQAPLADATNVPLVLWLTAPLFLVSAVLALLGFIPEARAAYGCCSSCSCPSRRQPPSLPDDDGEELAAPDEASPKGDDTEEGVGKDLGSEVWGHSGPLHLAIRPAISIHIARELTEVSLQETSQGPRDIELQPAQSDEPTSHGQPLLEGRRRIANESVSSVATAPARRRPYTRTAFRPDSPSGPGMEKPGQNSAGFSLQSLGEEGKRSATNDGRTTDAEEDQRPVDSCGTLALGIACGIAAITVAFVTLVVRDRPYMLILFFGVSISLLAGMKAFAPPIVFKAAMFGFWKEIFFLHSFSILDFWATASPECVPDGPHYALDFYQNYSAIVSNGVALLSIAAFPFLLSRRTFRQAVYITTIIKSLSTVFTIVLVKRWNLHIGVSDTVMFVFAVDVAFQFCAMLDFLPLVCLISRSCSRGVETTTFALLAAVLNFGETTSSVIAYVWAEALGISTSVPKATPSPASINVSTVSPLLFSNWTNYSVGNTTGAASPAALCDFSNLPLLLFLGQLVAPLAIIPLARLCLPDEPIDK